MKKNRAFTLIEVMVVLSILAIVAILAYNFFGGTMKEAKLKQATTKVYNDMVTLVGAAELYYMKNGTRPPNGITKTWVNGILKSYPTEDSTYHAPSNPTPYHVQLDRWNLGNTATLDDSIWWMTTDELCLEIEKAYNNAVAIPAASAAPAADKAIQCWYELGGEPGADKWIIMPIWLN